MKIIISEKQARTILAGQTVVNEQNDVITDQNALIVLQNKVNDLIDKKQKEILDTMTVAVLGTAQDLKIRIGEQEYPMKEMMRGIYALIIPPGSALRFTGSPMSTIMPEIEKMAEYKNIIDQHPEVSKQIEGGAIKGVLYTDGQNQGTFKFTVTKKPMDIGDLKTAVPFGTPYPFGEFLERNKFTYTFKNGLFGTLESGQISVNLSAMSLRLSPPQGGQPQAPKAPIQIKPMTLGDLFNYDNVDFRDQNTANQQMGAFVQQMKTLIQQYGEQFVKFIQSQNPTVLAYSSIDGDPAQPINGGYQPCAGNKTRQEYDLCLSQERAKKIAEILNSQLPELGGAIKFKGMGETNQFGPGWTKDSPTIPEQTSPNRRYVLTQMAAFTPSQ